MVNSDADNEFDFGFSYEGFGKRILLMIQKLTTREIKATNKPVFVEEVKLNQKGKQSYKQGEMGVKRLYISTRSLLVSRSSRASPPVAAFSACDAFDLELAVIIKLSAYSSFSLFECRKVVAGSKSPEIGNDWGFS
ncbi:hypothetical protein ACSBR2_040769 [Camellia fascicularis]